MVFKVKTDGSEYQVLHEFAPVNYSDTYAPKPALIQGVDGVLYGNTFSGGDTQGAGTVFKLNTDGSGYAVLHTFRTMNGMGAGPTSVLLEGSDGALYGTTFGGGDLNLGTVFALRPRPVLLPPVVSAGSQAIRFVGMPGSVHELQRAGALNGNWQILVTTTVPANGVVQFIDPTVPDTRAFYRTATFRGSVPTLDPPPAVLPRSTEHGPSPED